MKKLIYSFILFIISFSCFSQQDNRGTIKVEKKGTVYSLFFDNVNNRLIGKDIYGNILDSAVVSFDARITVQGVSYEESIIGTTLSAKMQNRIQRVDSGTTLYFTTIKVKEKNGTLIDWPKFNTPIGFAYEKQED